jgi:hypothetical protein
MNTTMFFALGILVSGAVFADDYTDRGKLMGSWQPASGETAAAWSFAPQGDSVKVTEVESGSTVADFVCNTDGKPCDVKISGKKVSVSLWYNGAKLVELEQHGADTVRRRFAVPASDQMEVEVTEMSSNGKSETLKFKRTAK